VSVDAVLGALVVFGAVVDVDFLELVSVGERASGDVDVVLGVAVHPHHQRLPGVPQGAAYLRKHTNMPVINAENTPEMPFFIHSRK